MTNRLPPFKSIEAFVVSAQLLSFTAAASVLHITVAAVSRRIAALEAELGIKLFHRTHRVLTLTGPGETYYHKLAPSIDIMRQATQSIRPSNRRETIKVSVFPLFAANWLVPRLPQFLDAHRGLYVDLETSAHFVDLDSSDVDLAIRFGDGNWPGVSTQRLLDVAVFPICSPGLIAKSRSLSTPLDVPKHRLLASKHCPDQWSEWFRAAGVCEPEAVKMMSFEDCHLMLEAAAHGLGIAIAFDVLVHPYLRTRQCIRLFEQAVHPAKRFYIVRPANSPRLAPVQSFCTWLSQQAAAWRQSIASRSIQTMQTAIAIQSRSA